MIDYIKSLKFLVLGVKDEVVGGETIRLPQDSYDRALLSACGGLRPPLPS